MHYQYICSLVIWVLLAIMFYVVINLHCCLDFCRWLSNNGLRQLPDEIGELAELQSL
jgi:hypothetical protein